MRSRRYWPTTRHRRSPSGSKRRDLARSRCRDRKHAGGRRRRDHYTALVVIATRGERLILAHASVGGRRVRGVQHGCAERRRNQLRTIRSRRSSYSSSTTSTKPSQSSMPDTSPAKRQPTRNVLQPVMDTLGGAQSSRRTGPMLGRTVFADHRRVTPFGYGGKLRRRAIEGAVDLEPDAPLLERRPYMRSTNTALVSTLVIEGTDAHEERIAVGSTPFCYL